MKKNIYQNENNEEVNNLLCDAVIKFDFIRVKVNSSVILNFSSSVAGMKKCSILTTNSL